jgi:hypothetical protein
VVLAIPCELFSAHLQLHIYLGYSLTKLLLQHPIHFLQDVFLLVAITNIDTPIVVAYGSKVKLFFSISIFNTCDEWTLHHDMCSMSFTEVLTWIKEGVAHAWKG